MRRSLLATAGLAVALSVAGCQGSTGSSTGATGTPTGTATKAATTTTTAVAGDDTVAWADKACNEIGRMNDALATITPPNLTNPDVRDLLRVLDEFITKYSGSIDEAIARIKGIGSPPIAGDEQALTASLEELKKILEAAKTKLAAVDPNNQQQAQAAIIEAFAEVAQMANQKHSPELTAASQQLVDAFDKAPNCQRLETSVVPTTTTTT